MILQALNDLYERLEDEPDYGVPPYGYSLQKITFKVVIRPDGDLVGIEDVRFPSGKRMKPRQLIVPGTNKPSGSGINPCFLWDNTQYMLGFKPDDSKPERTHAAFRAFRERHLAAKDEIDAAAFSAVCRFLDAWDPRDTDDPVLEEAGSTGFGVFQIVGETRFVHDLKEVRTWWSEQDDAEDAIVGQCLVTGSRGPLARTHDKIRGVVGGQGSGGTIAGFNDTAYESYGKSQSFNAPVSQRVAFRYVNALNALLDGPKKERHRFRLGDATIAFWTDRPSVAEDFFTQFATEGSRVPEAGVQDEEQRQRIAAFLEALRRGREAYADLDADPERTSFHLLGLSPNAARISVRFFYHNTIAELLDNLRKHHTDIGLVRRPPTGKWAGDPEFPSLRDVLDQTARETKDVPPLLAAPLLRAVILGVPYPHGLFAATVRRIHADRRVDYLKSCVLKGYLNRNLNHGLLMGLDTSRADPAYRMGRLFAALEKTQKDALGRNLNKTIRDSFYSSASATPRSVFPRLLRTYQHHLSKLDGGWRVNRERLVQEILGPVETFPGQLDLAGQGLFAIGYYHQTDAFYRKPTDDSPPQESEE